MKAITNATRNLSRCIVAPCESKVAVRRCAAFFLWLSRPWPRRRPRIRTPSRRTLRWSAKSAAGRRATHARRPWPIRIATLEKLLILHLLLRSQNLHGLRNSFLERLIALLPELIHLVRINRQHLVVIPHPTGRDQRCDRLIALIAQVMPAIFMPAAAGVQLIPDLSHLIVLLGRKSKLGPQPGSILGLLGNIGLHDRRLATLAA